MKTNHLFNLNLIAALLFSGSALFAHEGHDHGTPGVMKAPHGGITQGGKNIDIEVVQNEDSIVVYGLRSDSSSLAPTDFQITGTVEFPKAKASPLNFSSQKDNYSAKLSFKTSDGKSLGHRAKVIIQATAKGKPTESFTLQLEPQN